MISPTSTVLFTLKHSYYPDGKLECAGIYENNDKRKLINQDFKIIYPSNCKIIHLTDGERQNIAFVRITNG